MTKVTKTQLKAVADAINQTNANENTRKTFTIGCSNAYFTPDGYIGYEIPMEILYQAEEIHGITIPEASEVPLYQISFPKRVGEIIRKHP